MSNLRRCANCRRLLPTSAFYASGRGRLRSDCRTCNVQSTAHAKRLARVPGGRSAWARMNALHAEHGDDARPTDPALRRLRRQRLRQALRHYRQAGLV